jgi:hypothetical protein
MVSLGAKANLKRLNSKLEHKARTAGGLSETGFLDPRARTNRPLARRDRAGGHAGPVKPAGKERMPVARWVARGWIQPIGKP